MAKRKRRNPEAANPPDLGVSAAHVAGGVLLSLVGMFAADRCLRIAGLIPENHGTARGLLRAGVGVLGGVAILSADAPPEAAAAFTSALLTSGVGLIDRDG